MPYGLPKAVIDRIVKVLSGDAAVERALLFGSRAAGQERPGSDIDLCLEGKRLGVDDLLRLARKLEDLDLPWKIDLVARDELDNQELLSRIDRVGRILFEREHEVTHDDRGR